MWFQLPTPQDGGDSRRELFDPESKLLGRPQGWAELLATAQARQVSSPSPRVGRTASLPRGTRCSCLLSHEPWIRRSVQGFRQPHGPL